MYYVDFHTHSTFSSSKFGRLFEHGNQRLISAVASLQDIDAIVVTNHNFSSVERRVNGVLFIPGIEVSTTEGHLIIIGENPPEKTERRKLTPSETVALAREKECITVLPHPYRKSNIKDYPVSIDAIGLNGKHAKTSFEHVEELAQERGVPIVGGSDAHTPFEIGGTYTKVDINELTVPNVLEAVRTNNVEPVINDSKQYTLPRKYYNRVRERKNDLEYNS